MKNKYLLVVGVVLILFGLSRSAGISIPILPSPDPACPVVEIEEPSNEELKGLADAVVECWQNGSDDRSVDGKRLASLYNDMSLLISIDDDAVIKNTDAIREANILAAKLLKINLKDKYDGLAKAMTNLLETYVTDQSVPLDDDLRAKASEAFKALAWACSEGSK